MYQGEVNVPEEDLPGFLEVAEDLNIKGLSERNMDSCDSNQEDPSQFTPSKFDLSPEGNTSTIKNETPPNISDSESSHSIIEYQQPDESFAANDNVSDSMFVPTGKQRLINKKCNESTRLNIVSTSAGNQFNCGNSQKEKPSCCFCRIKD